MKINNSHVIRALQRDAVDVQLYKAMLQEYEQKLKYVLEKNNMYVWRTDWQQGTVSISRSLYELGRSISYKAYEELACEEDREQAHQTMQTIAEAKEPISLTCRFRPNEIDPTTSWYEINAIPTYDEEGRTIGYFGLSRNITQWMNIQEQVKAETARAEASIRQKREFLANMTHEIRTPLNAIIGFSELLHEADTKEQKQDMIQLINSNCDMLQRLIDGILEVASIDSQPLEWQAQEVDFPRFFDEVCQSLKPRVQDAGVAFLQDNPSQALSVMVDPEKIREVITHFVTNAVKYTQQGYIKIGYRQEADALVIYCEDTGIGIPKDQQTTIFERFVKLDSYVQGTGLGLHICQVIAESCGGSIGVDSEGTDKGSTFWLRIPL